MNHHDHYDSHEYNVQETARLYQTTYKIMGRNKKLLMEMSICIVANDVADILDSIRSKILGKELNGKDAKGVCFFETVDAIDIITCELVAPIHGATEKAIEAIKAACDSITDLKPSFSPSDDEEDPSLYDNDNYKDEPEDEESDEENETPSGNDSEEDEEESD